VFSFEKKLASQGASKKVKRGKPFESNKVMLDKRGRHEKIMVHRILSVNRASSIG
jgi:hypothetical protein